MSGGAGGGSGCGDRGGKGARAVEWLRELAAAALGVAPATVDPDRPLTALGLDSLAAIELRSAVEEARGAAPPLAELLSGATVRELAAAALAAAERIPAAADHPLAAGQQALWFLERLAPAAGAHNIAVAARVRGLDAAALRRAMTALVARHAALRSVFPLAGEAPVQRVLPAGEIDFALVPAAAWSEGRLRRRLDEEAWRPFDLARGPLLRLRLFTRRGGERVLLLAVHHIAADFWSLGILARELSALLGAPAAPGTLLPRAPRHPRDGGRPDGGGGTRSRGAARSYADFVAFQARLLAGPQGERLRAFWRLALDGDRGPVPDLALPVDRLRPAAQQWRGLARAAHLPAALAAPLRALAAAEGATLFALLAAAWQLQLGRYAGQQDFAIGAPTSGRAGREWDGVVGYLVNPVALRADLAGEPSFRDLLGRVRRTAVAALEHAALPFVLLAQELRPRRSPARPPLFQVLLALEPRRPGDPAGLAAFALGIEGARLALGAGVELSALALAERPAPLELSLAAAEREDGGLALVLEASAALFDAATVERMLGHLATLLAAALAAPDGPAADLRLLSAAEMDQLRGEARGGRDGRHRHRGGGTASRAAQGAPLLLHQLVAARARRSPRALALVAGGERLTYAELAARAGALARRLRPALGEHAERPVALLVERSADLVAAALGILAAGGVYLPLDPDDAAPRLRAVLDDARPAVLLTRRRLAGRLAVPAGVLVLDLDAPDELGDPDERDGPDERDDPDAAALTGGPAIHGEQLAYLIYTSGSTGRPKGVAVSHAAAAEHCRTWARAYRLGARDRVLQLPPAAFDAAFEQTFATLVAGAALVMRGPEPWGPAELTACARAEGLTVADVPTAFFARWVEDAAGLGPAPPALRLIGVSGEELRRETVRRFAGTPLAAVPVLNCYGPTEAVVSATLARVDAPGEGPVPIGRPLPGRVARVLDRRGQPQPAGIPGELCLGGVLARGYLGRPERTAERFVPDPWGGPGERLYHTGDLVRRRAAGELEFLGRIDDQVKVRGFRVEPGEVEAALAAHPDVREAAVIAAAVPGDPEAPRRLVAFVAPALPADLAALAAARLPGYMLPAAWLALPALPLNPHGKVDRSALARRAASAMPLPAFAAPRGDGSGAGDGGAPRTPAEELLAGIWADLLGRDRVGIDDDFFALGGHSLLATRVVARVTRCFGVELPVAAVFAAPTVARLAERIAAAGPAAGGAAPGTRRRRRRCAGCRGPAASWRSRVPACRPVSWRTVCLHSGPGTEVGR
ncbi:MAG TPA: amino acid adenylation domain-containing protein [Thermoanaerobaculia bacterium]|nr:amino acid adenylation domain-containing protein [Thermoanaerobaculia bacterium]